MTPREIIGTSLLGLVLVVSLGLAGRLDYESETQTQTTTRSTTETTETQTETTTSTSPTEIADALVALVVDVPATPEDAPEDASERLATALRELGATASCPGECLVYVDRVGTIVWFRFNP